MQNTSKNIKVQEGNFTPVPWLIIRDPLLSPTAKVIFAILLSRAGAKETCRTGWIRLASDADCSRRMVGKCLKELELRKLVFSEQRGKKLVNKYTPKKPDSGEKFTIFTNEFVRSKWKPIQKIVYMVLASRANKKGLCFPGLETLAKEVGCSRRAIVLTLNKLVKRRMVKKSGRGSSRTTLYKFSSRNCRFFLMQNAPRALHKVHHVHFHIKKNKVQEEPVIDILRMSTWNCEKIHNSHVSEEKSEMKECLVGTQNTEDPNINNGNFTNMPATFQSDGDEIESSDYLGGLRSDYDVADEFNASPINVVNYFLTEYESNHGKPHPNIVTERLEECLESISCFNDDMRVEPADWENMVRRFFVDFRNRPKTAQRLELFCNPEILMNRWQEECY